MPQGNEKISPEDILKKFGDHYTADDHTFVLGIDARFAGHFAERFRQRNVLETCTGAGFTTISLARTANRVITVEVDKEHQDQAKKNVRKAGLDDRVEFLYGSILDSHIKEQISKVDGVFIDPDWACTGPNHVYRFLNSNMKPPADVILQQMLQWTNNVALVLPPFIDIRELEDLPEHEQESLYLNERHELYCLYFGDLIGTPGKTEYRISD